MARRHSPQTMNHELLKAVATGDADLLAQVLGLWSTATAENHDESFLKGVTADGSSALHIAASHGEGLTPLDVAMNRTNSDYTFSVVMNCLIMLCLQATGAHRSLCHQSRNLTDKPCLEDKEKESSNYTNVSQSILYISVLIAAGSFAAAFTVPGGYIAEGLSERKADHTLARIALSDLKSSDMLTRSAGTEVRTALQSLGLYFLMHMPADPNLKRTTMHKSSLTTNKSQSVEIGNLCSSGCKADSKKIKAAGTTTAASTTTTMTEPASPEMATAPAKGDDAGTHAEAAAGKAAAAQKQDAYPESSSYHSKCSCDNGCATYSAAVGVATSMSTSMGCF
ncbi:hypothetical protein BAE44_0016806 [Dichanthelium oligosanthes]|uniref:PGG domain-containing protein n=1 Tax=Dichanthelium oligosanthes TaxID=888268 RepID=A0A1E5VAX5_9POAL|nr:hypothetical protein BAE44_0016806 [Dichanthelium oligosanthes]